MILITYQNISHNQAQTDSSVSGKIGTEDSIIQIEILFPLPLLSEHLPHSFMQPIRFNCFQATNQNMTVKRACLRVVT